jgi:hypothetical protein
MQKKKMSKLNQIQRALQEIGSAEFQKLGDAFLSEKNYKNLNPLGSIIGSNKVRKGTPDTFLRNEFGRYIFVEHTTTVQDKLLKKLKKDFQKCVDESLTGISTNLLEEIIFCHTSKLTLKQENEIYQLADAHGIKCQIYGLESISLELYRYYPGLALDFLNISIDTNQILSPQSFIEGYGRNHFATPLSTEFVFREEEIEQGMEALDKNNLLLISGRTGVGKSRLTLEILKRFKERNGSYEVYCILDRGQDLFEDIQVYFSRPGHFIIFVDDANRIGKFDYFLYLLYDQKVNQRIKIVATVRDYALEKIRKLAEKNDSTAEMSINALDAHSILTIVKSHYKISNNVWLERICSIAAGNPRLALMAAKVVVEGKSDKSLKDVSTIYDQYFSSIQDDLDIFHSETTMKVAGIISFLRRIDRANHSEMSLIYSVFNIDEKAFWDEVCKLHNAEIVDLYENEAVKTADQVLSEFLFYQCFFKKNIISIETLLDNFFPSLIYRIEDSIYPCLEDFGFEKIVDQIRKPVRNKFEYLLSNGDQDIDILIKSFWFVVPTDSLLFIQDNICSLDFEQADYDSVDWDTSDSNFDRLNRLIKLLSLFADADERDYKIALDLIFELFQKRRSLASSVLKVLTENFSFSLHSLSQNYLRQAIIIESIEDRAQQREDIFLNRLLLEVSKKLLKLNHNYIRRTKRGIPVDHSDSDPMPAVFLVRKKMWRLVFKLYDIPELQGEVLSLLNEACISIRYFQFAQIVKKDFEQLLPFIKTRLKPEEFGHCLFVSRYLKLSKISKKENPFTEFTSPKLSLYKMVTAKYSDRSKKMSLDEFRTYRKRQVENFLKEFTFEDYKKALLDIQEMSISLDSEQEKFSITNGVLDFLLCLSEKDSSLFVKVVSFYLSIGNPFNVNSYFVVRRLIDCSDASEAFEVVSSVEFQLKNAWLFSYFQAVHASFIAKEDVERIHLLYENSDLNEIPESFDYLISYHDVDDNVIVNVTNILVLRAQKEDRNFARKFSGLFGPYSKVAENFNLYFEGHHNVFKLAYFVHDKVEKHADYDGHALNLILDICPDFLLEYMDNLQEDYENFDRSAEGRNYYSFWSRKDVEQIMRRVIMYIVEAEDSYILEKFFHTLFGIELYNNTPEDALQKQYKFLKSVIQDFGHNADIVVLIFKVIGNVKVSERLELILTLLDFNKSYDLFDRLQLEPSHWSWSGSAVPVLSHRLEFWRSLHSQCSTFDLLRHRRDIEEHIRGLENRVESEKKSDFMTT